MRMYICMYICMHAKNCAYMTYLAVLGGSVGWEIIVSDNAGTPSVSASPSGAISGNEPHSTDRNTLASDQARNERTDSPLTFKIILPAVSPACSAIESWYIHACDMTRLFVIHWLSKWYCPLKMKEVLYQYGRLFFWREYALHELSLLICMWHDSFMWIRASWAFFQSCRFFFFVPNVRDVHCSSVSHIWCEWYEWGMSHIWMSHVTHMDESCHTYQWVLSHIWMSHVTPMNESCHTYQWVLSHIGMSHVTHVNESCHTCEWVMSLTHANESCHTYGWVMSHVGLSHVTHINESCHTYGWVMSQIWMSHVAHMNRLGHTHECVTRMDGSCQTIRVTHAPAK